MKAKPWLRRSALTLAVWDGAVIAAHNALTTGAVLTGFLILLGASPSDFAWAEAIRVLAQGAPLLIAPWLTGGVKRRAIATLTLGRALWLPALALPWFLSGGQVVVVFLAIYALNRMLDAVGQATWLTWMSSLVPAGMRGRYFARRNAVQLLSGLCAGLAAAWLLDHAGRTRETFGALLVGAVLLGIASALLMGAQPERAQEERRVTDQEPPPPERRRGIGFWTHVLMAGVAGGGVVDEAHTSRLRFAKFLAFFTLWGLGNGISQPFWAPYELQRLQVSFGLLAVISAAGSLMGAFALPLWGRVADRVGDRRVLAATILWGSFHPLLWIFMRPDRLWPLWIDAISSGIVWNGFELVATNLLLRLAPAGSGELAYGSLAAVRGLAGTASSLFAVWLVKTVPGMLSLLVVAAPIRWACLGMIWLVEDPRTAPPKR